LAAAGVVLIGYAALLTVQYLSVRDEAIPADIQVVDDVIDEMPIVATLAAHSAPNGLALGVRGVMTSEFPMVKSAAASVPQLAATTALPAYLPGDAPPANEQANPQTNAQPSDDRLRLGSPTRIVIASINVDSPAVEVGLTSVYRSGQLLDQWQVANFAA